MYKASIKDGVAAEDIRTLKKNPTPMPWDGRKQELAVGTLSECYYVLEISISS